jgi:hypothetical protein
MNQQNATDPLTPKSDTFTLDSAGALSNIISCPDVKTCVSSNIVKTLTVDSSGGYDVNVFGSGIQGRVFAYRAGGGELMMVGVGEDGTWIFTTKKRVNAMPSVGTVNTGWNVGTLNATVNGGTFQSAFDTSDYQYTVTSVDTTLNTFNRSLVLNFTGPITRTETLLLNTVACAARAGYDYRAQGSVLNSAGVNSTINESI